MNGQTSFATAYVDDHNSFGQLNGFYCQSLGGRSSVVLVANWWGGRRGVKLLDFMCFAAGCSSILYIFIGHY